MYYHERTYRNKISTGNLNNFEVKVKETDLSISTDGNLQEIATESVYRYRKFIEDYIKNHPHFLHSIVSFCNDSFAPPIIKDMIGSSRAVGVGPMASVAGAVAQYVGNDLLRYSENVIVENGGDVFLKVQNEVNIGIFAGKSPLSYKVALKIKPKEMPIGVCTSSGTVGHSLSFGKADAVCVTSRSATLADAAATSICNCVKKEEDIRKNLDMGLKIEGVLGLVIIMNDKLGACGEIELA